MGNQRQRRQLSGRSDRPSKCNRTNHNLHRTSCTPIYGSIPVANGTVQGTVTITAQVSANPANAFDNVGTHVTFVITGPISVNASPTTASVRLGATQQFTGYTIGSTNNAITWQVNGVAGGATATGTITTAGLYMAPAALPMNGNTVTITAVSQADSTKTASSVVTLSSS